MVVMGVMMIVECGFGKVLVGLSKCCVEGVIGIVLVDVIVIDFNVGLE